MPEGLSVYQPRQKYFLLDENQIAENILDEAGGASAWIFRLERAHTQTEFLEILRELKKRLPDDFSQRAMLKWADGLWSRKASTDTWEDLPTEEAPMLEEKIVQWENDILQKGIAQGLEQGISQGLEQGISKGLELGISQGLAQGINQGKVMAYQEIILDNLGNRFGKIAASLQEAILKISDLPMLAELAGASLRVKNPDEFEKMLKTKTTLQ